MGSPSITDDNFFTVPDICFNYNIHDGFLHPNVSNIE